MFVSIIIPTYNAQKEITKLLQQIRRQSLVDFELIVIDSTSEDLTVEKAREYADRVEVIPKEEFRHGGTRTKAAKLARGELLVFMTQDVLLYDDSSIEKLIAVFEDERVGAAYGRQLPHLGEKPFGAHLRHFNYGELSYKRIYDDKHQFGIKTAFLSDSFAAYRRDALEKIGWFKMELNFGEDMYAGAKLLKEGFSLAYVAEAMVYHSHSYRLKEEYRRYYETGKFHQQEAWLIEEFGKPEGEGLRFVKSEWKYLLKRGYYYLLPLSLIRNMIKLLGYKMGKFSTEIQGR